MDNGCVTTSDERAVEAMEAFAAEHGIPALLDHLGLDLLGNEVNGLYAERDDR